MGNGLTGDILQNSFKEFDLLKAAKLPEGSKRKFGPNWYIKQGGKWVYLPSSEHKEHKVGKHLHGGLQNIVEGETKKLLNEQLVLLPDGFNMLAENIAKKVGFSDYRKLEAAISEFTDGKRLYPNNPGGLADHLKGVIEGKEKHPTTKDEEFTQFKNPGKRELTEFERLNKEHFDAKLKRSEDVANLVGKESTEGYVQITGDKAQNLQKKLTFLRTIPDWAGDIPKSDGKGGAILYQKGDVVFGVYKKKGELRVGTVGSGGSIESLDDFLEEKKPKRSGFKEVRGDTKLSEGHLKEMSNKYDTLLHELNMDLTHGDSPNYDDIIDNALKYRNEIWDVTKKYDDADIEVGDVKLWELAEEAGSIGREATDKKERHLKEVAEKDRISKIKKLKSDPAKITLKDITSVKVEPYSVDEFVGVSVEVEGNFRNAEEFQNDFGDNNAIVEKIGGLIFDHPNFKAGLSKLEGRSLTAEDYEDGPRVSKRIPIPTSHHDWEEWEIGDGVATFGFSER